MAADLSMPACAEIAAEGCALQIAWTYLLSRAASDTQPLPEDDEGYVEAHPS